MVRKYNLPYETADNLHEYLRINRDDEAHLFEPENEGEPTSELPGPTRAEVYRRRVENGEEIFNENDRNEYGSGDE